MQECFFSAASTERGIAELAVSIKQETVFWVHLIHSASHHHPYADMVWFPSPSAMGGIGSSTNAFVSSFPPVYCNTHLLL